MIDIENVAKDETIYLVMNDGSVYLATTDEEYAANTLNRLELSNIRYAEECCGMSEEEAPMTVSYIAGREGDHVYVDEIYEGLAFFDDNDEYETSEGDIVTEYDVESNFQFPSEYSDEDPLDFDD